MTLTTYMTTTTTSQRRLVALCVVLGALLVLVAALAAWLGRDEFHQMREDVQASASDAAEPAEADGPPAVRLSAAAQRNLGLKTAAPVEATRAAGGAMVELQVVDPQTLAEARGRLRAAVQERDAARAQAEASARELRRVQGLFDDDRSASQRALDAARAQAAADAAHQGAQQAAVDSLQAAAQAAWGRTVAGWLAAPLATPLDHLFTGQAALLRAQATAGAVLPPGHLRLDTGGDARALDGGTPAQRLYRVEPARLAPGQRLWARAAGQGAPADGAWVPASAVVWHAGQAWIYLLQSADDDDAAPATAPAASASASAAAAAPTRASFRRRALAGAERVDERWFVPGLEDEDTVVVQGAQVLLSEELKFQLRNENDD